NRDRVGPGLRRQACSDVKAAFAFKDGADRAARQGQIDNILHVADVDAIACHVQAVNADAQLGLVRLLFDGRISGTPDLPEQVEALGSQSPQRLQVRATDDEGQVSGGAGSD